MVFHYDISVTFIQTIDPTSFNYGMLLCFTEERFHRFYREVLLNDTGIIICLINIANIANAFSHCITIIIYSVYSSLE